MSVLVNLIQYIKGFLHSLFFSSDEEINSQKALRAIMQEVKTCKYPVYRNDNTILAGLPMIIYELYRVSLLFTNLLKESICSTDIRISNFFLDKLVEGSFSDQQKKLREKILFANRIESFGDFTGEDFEQKLKDQVKDFDELLFSLSDPSFKTVDIRANKLFAFFDFCSFKFNAFFAYFDPGFSTIIDSDTIREHFNFENVDGMTILQEILDLDYLIRHISLDEDLASILFFINSMMPEEKKLDEPFLKKNLQLLSFTITTSLGKNTLSNLAKLIKQDPSFEDKIKPPRSYSELEEYKTRVIAGFSSDTKKILKLRQDAQMASLINELFENQEMLKLNVYNEELNNRIQVLTKLSLDWIKPLEILKTYTKCFFKPLFEPFLRELLVEGFFEDKKMQSAFASDYYYCAAIVEKIDDLEKIMYGKNESSIELIRGYLTRIESGGDFEKPLSKIIDEMNLRAKKFLEEAGSHYINLFKFCNLIIRDAYKAVPEYVHNINAMINSTKNKDRFSVFSNGLENFEKMIELLKKYVVIDISEFN